jgi:hypothetical protein
MAMVPADFVMSRLMLQGVRLAIGDPVLITEDESVARRVLGLLGEVPTPVWGRDELKAGEMWNSNSVIAWVLHRAGVVERAGSPPREGRAPGWGAGVAVARRAAVESQHVAA